MTNTTDWLEIDEDWLRSVEATRIEAAAGEAANREAARTGWTDAIPEPETVEAAWHLGEGLLDLLGNLLAALLSGDD